MSTKIHCKRKKWCSCNCYEFFIKTFTAQNEYEWNKCKINLFLIEDEIGFDKITVREQMTEIIKNAMSQFKNGFLM